ncbi:MAG: glycosyltransferase family 4 protein [Candidatus Kerfeldbacteria bacterium]|nr:glycosyltransferase family 4 protein [Candidatus Kerfeldbacteria bacterium]
MLLGVDIRCLQDQLLTGVGEYTWRILQALKALKPGVELAGFGSAVKDMHLPPGVPEIMKVVRSRWPNKLKNLVYSWGWAEPLDLTISRQVGPLDACWLPNPNFARFSGRVPVVITVHDLSWLRWPEFFRRRPRLWYFPAVVKLLNNGLPPQSKVVAVSQHTADDIINFFPHLQNRLQIISPGVGPEFTDKPSAARLAKVRSEYRLPEKFILSMGTIEPRKNYRLLLQAYQFILNRQPSYQYDLVIAGGWGWRYRSLIKLYRSLPTRTQQRIHWLGYVSEADKPALYHAATLFVYPSFYEGFGIPPLEAMASGLPVLVSHSSSLPEVVGEAGLMLSPYGVGLWAELIQQLTNDQVWAAELGQRGRERAQKFTWQKSAQAYYDLFTR